MQNKRFYAHSKEGRPKEEWQTLEEHLKNVAERAEKYAAKFQSADWGWNAGWLHDLGKAADEFQAYLLRENSLDEAEYDGVGHGRVSHSSAGAAFEEEILGPIIVTTNVQFFESLSAAKPSHSESCTTSSTALSFLMKPSYCRRMSMGFFHCFQRNLLGMY